MGAFSASAKTGQAGKATKRIPTRAGRALLRPVPPLVVPDDPAYRIVLMAVEALDELVADMIRQSHGNAPRDFFDWIADEMTPLLEIMARAHFCDHGWPGMAAASATRDWVRTVCQGPLERKFREMSVHAARQTPRGAALTRASRAG